MIAHMRRSREIPTCVLLLAASAALAGCNEHRDCVDAGNRKEPDSYCNAGTHLGAHFLYGGRSGGSYGDAVVGGRSTASGISRGGFGHGGGGGEGE
jgi:hypothetical protein